MALFGAKKKKEEKKPAKDKAAKTAPEKSVAVVGNISPSNIASIIIRPRITEKSGLLSHLGVYTFEITAEANKNTVAKAVTALYKVTPVKVAIINSPAKEVFVRGRWGKVSGIRKAIVTVKKGDKIDFV